MESKYIAYHFKIEPKEPLKYIKIEKNVIWNLKTMNC